MLYNIKRLEPLTMKTMQDEPEKIEKQQSVFFSLLISYLLLPDFRNMETFRKHAHTMSPPQDEKAQEMLDRFRNDDPLLWFRLLTVIDQEKYDLATLESIGVLSTARMSSLQIRNSLARRIIRNSRYPGGQWIIIERSDSGKTDKKVFSTTRRHGIKMPTMAKSERLYLVAVQQPDKIAFRHDSKVK